MNRPDKSKFRSVKVFQYFIQFLEIYGQENYGESAEVSWPRVMEFCSSYGIFDFNSELEEVIYADTDEEFRDKAFSYIEKQILEGYPVWRLFDMSSWLYNQLEKELIERENAKDVEYFNKTRCYRCKHFADIMEYFNSSGLPRRIYPGEEPKEVDIRAVTIHHMMSCSKRNSLLEEMENASSSSRFLRSSNVKFSYNKFNCEDLGFMRDQRKWDLIPWELKKRPYFDDAKITPEEFKKTYFEIPRLYKESE